MATNRFSTPAFQSRLRSLTEIRDQLKIVLDRWCQLYDADDRYDDRGNISTGDVTDFAREIQADIDLAASSRGMTSPPLNADTLNMHMLGLFEPLTNMNSAIDLLEGINGSSDFDQPDHQSSGRDSEERQPDQWRTRPDTDSDNGSDAAGDQHLIDCREEEVLGLAEQLSDEDLQYYIGVWESEIAGAVSGLIKLDGDSQKAMQKSYRLNAIDRRLKYLREAYTNKEKRLSGTSSRGIARKQDANWGDEDQEDQQGDEFEDEGFPTPHRFRRYGTGRPLGDGEGDAENTTTDPEPSAQQETSDHSKDEEEDKVTDGLKNMSLEEEKSEDDRSQAKPDPAAPTASQTESATPPLTTNVTASPVNATTGAHIPGEQKVTHEDRRLGSQDANPSQGGHLGKLLGKRPGKGIKGDDNSRRRSEDKGNDGGENRGRDENASTAGEGRQDAVTPATEEGSDKERETSKDPGTDEGKEERRDEPDRE